MGNKRGKNSSEPTWPTGRSVERYNLLLGIDLAALLAEGGLWIEIGPGTNALPMLPFVGRKDVSLTAIGPHPRSLPEGIQFAQGMVPEDKTFFATNRARARLVTDVYGAVSYCKDPVQALIFGSLLLARGGVFLAFTELYRFGDLPNWERITEFFRIKLRQVLSFETISVRGDASKTYSTCLRVRVQGPSLKSKCLDEIFDEAARSVGIPVPTRTLWTAEDRSASISRVDYVSQPETSDTKARAKS